MKGYCYEPCIYRISFSGVWSKKSQSNGGKSRRDYCLHFQNRVISRILFLSGEHCNGYCVWPVGEFYFGWGGGGEERETEVENKTD